MPERIRPETLPPAGQMKACYSTGGLLLPLISCCLLQERRMGKRMVSENTNTLSRAPSMAVSDASATASKFHALVQTKNTTAGPRPPNVPPKVCSAVLVGLDCDTSMESK